MFDAVATTSAAFTALATSATRVSPSARAVRPRALAWATTAALHCAPRASGPGRPLGPLPGAADRPRSTASRRAGCEVGQSRSRDGAPALARPRREGPAAAQIPCAIRWAGWSLCVALRRDLAGLDGAQKRGAVYPGCGSPGDERIGHVRLQCVVGQRHGAAHWLTDRSSEGGR